jgi:ketosteroid isomerase-like protein
MPSPVVVLRVLCVGVLVAVGLASSAGAQTKSTAKPGAKSTTAKKAPVRKPTAKRTTTRRAPAPEPVVRAATDDSAAAREARAAFARYTEAFNAGRDLDAMAFYSDDSRFHWVEDGKLAYTSAAMIRESVAQVRKLFPTVAFEPGEVRTTVFGRDAVQLTVPFAQRLVDGGGVASTFEGSMTLSLTKGSGSWRAISGHTSIRRPGGR